MAYEMVMPYHLHMPSYFLETFTEYPSLLLQNPAYILQCHCKAVAVALHTDMQYDCNSYAVILQHVCSRTAKYMQQECKQDAVIKYPYRYYGIPEVKN